LDPKKYPTPENWPYDEARKLFTDPDVTDVDSIQMTWNAPDEEGLVAFMSAEKGKPQTKLI